MIKGKVIEVHSRYSIVAAEDGNFYKIKNYGDMAIGQRVLATEEDLYMESIKHKSFSFKQMAVIAAMLVLMTSFGTFFMMDQFSAYASVVVDVNPRVEILINKNDDVLSARALNDDGLGFDLAVLKGLKIEDAIEQLVNQVGSQGYLKGQDAYVLITTVPLKEMSDSSKKALNDKILNTISASPVLQKTNVAVTQITKEQLEQAKSDDVPAGLVTFEVDDDGDKSLSVQDFFKIEDNQKAFSAVGTVVQGTQVDAVAAASQSTSNSSTGDPSDDSQEDNDEIDDDSDENDDSDDSSSTNSLSDLRADLAERLAKLKGISNPSSEVMTLIAQADAYFANGSGNLTTLEAEARRLWEQVKDQQDVSDDDNGTLDEDDDESDDDSDEVDDDDSVDDDSDDSEEAEDDDESDD